MFSREQSLHHDAVPPTLAEHLHVPGRSIHDAGLWIRRSWPMATTSTFDGCHSHLDGSGLSETSAWVRPPARKHSASLFSSGSFGVQWSPSRYWVFNFGCWRHGGIKQLGAQVSMNARSARSRQVFRREHFGNRESWQARLPSVTVRAWRHVFAAGDLVSCIFGVRLLPASVSFLSGALSGLLAVVLFSNAAPWFLCVGTVISTVAPLSDPGSPSRHFPMDDQFLQERILARTVIAHCFSVGICCSSRSRLVNRSLCVHPSD